MIRNIHIDIRAKFLISQFILISSVKLFRLFRIELDLKFTQQAQSRRDSCGNGNLKRMPAISRKLLA